MKYGERPDRRCPTRPYSDSYGPVGSRWTNAVYALDKTGLSKSRRKGKKYWGYD
jgi:hypothetical protein